LLFIQQEIKTKSDIKKKLTITNNFSWQ